jgi:hypothetical protein
MQPRRNYISNGLVGLCFTAWVLARTACPAHAQTNLLPDMDNPKLQFSTGLIVDNKPQISPILPAIPGTPSGWKVSQFDKTDTVGLLTPQNMTVGGETDPILGTALYGFAAQDGHDHVEIFKNPATGHLVYELYESGGALGAGGGTDILLSTSLTKPFPTFDHQLNFSMQAKISRADASYDNPAAISNGAVLAQVGMAFIISFPSPVNNVPSTLFLQISLAHSGRKALAGLPSNAPFTASCTLFKNGSLGVFTVGTLSGVTPLQFKTDNGPLHDISINLNDYINKLFGKPRTCGVKGGPAQTVAFNTIDLSKVVLRNAFIGPETEIADHRKTSTFLGPQGSIDMAIQVSNLTITEDSK